MLNVDKLPAAYKWLGKLEGVPNTILRAMELFGVQEVVGKGSDKTIISWRDELNQAGVRITGFSDDDIPWCGLFAAIVTFRRMGLVADVVKEPLWARNWANYGLRSKTPGLGDVLVFGRDGGGHVGFYFGEDSSAYHVLGGNQSNKVCITRVAKSRLLEARRPRYNTLPAAVKPYHLASGGKLSTNEA